MGGVARRTASGGRGAALGVTSGASSSRRLKSGSSKLPVIGRDGSNPLTPFKEKSISGPSGSVPV